MFNHIAAFCGTINIVVNNAGIQEAAANHEIDMVDFDRVLNVSISSARQASRHFLSNRGVMLNNSSVQTIVSKPKYPSCSSGTLDRAAHHRAQPEADFSPWTAPTTVAEFLIGLTLGERPLRPAVTQQETA